MTQSTLTTNYYLSLLSDAAADTLVWMEHAKALTAHLHMVKCVHSALCVRVGA